MQFDEIFTNFDRSTPRRSTGYENAISPYSFEILKFVTLLNCSGDMRNSSYNGGFVANSKLLHLNN